MSPSDFMTQDIAECSAMVTKMRKLIAWGDQLIASDSFPGAPFEKRQAVIETRRNLIRAEEDLIKYLLALV